MNWGRLSTRRPLPGYANVKIWLIFDHVVPETTKKRDFWRPECTYVYDTNSSADSTGHGGHVPPTFTNGWAWGHRE